MCKSKTSSLSRKCGSEFLRQPTCKRPALQRHPTEASIHVWIHKCKFCEKQLPTDTFCSPHTNAVLFTEVGAKIFVMDEEVTADCTHKYKPLKTFL